MTDAKQILDLLSTKKNVMLTGAPGTGKSTLMNEVADLFENGFGENPPAYVSHGPIPIPSTPAESNPTLISIFSKPNRKVFRTTFHQNSKYRDFVSGIFPRFGHDSGYEVHGGVLYEANEFARCGGCAALLIIDEFNRGPAIEVFGGSIVAIEPDKRLGDDGHPLSSTQFFSILDPKGDPDKGMLNDAYALSPNLYILASMNQADASVAPIDVAFLRRWQSVPLEPNYDALYSRFGVPPNYQYNDSCISKDDAFAVAIQAIKKLNSLISIGRGAAYQIGQGLLLSTKPASTSKDDSLMFLCEVWPMIYAHLEELFFGDTNTLAFLLNAQSSISPYEVEEIQFAGEEKLVLSHKAIDESSIYDLLRAVAAER